MWKCSVVVEADKLAVLDQYKHRGQPTPTMMYTSPIV